jgi:N-acetylneuraminic acid mutarotase
MRAIARLTAALFLLAAPAVALAGSAGSWRPIPPAPVVVDANLSGVWTGKQLLVYGVAGVAPDGNFLKAAAVAEAYDPAARTWRRLPDPPGQPDSFIRHSAVWTGSKMLVLGPFSTLSFDPASNRWRRLPRGHGGFAVWTGSELIAWGGGCCGDAFSDGVAYRPASNTWRKLPASPLAGSQSPVGAWTGRELILLVGGLSPDGKPWPARLARAAAYDPATNRWRRIAPPPAPRYGATAAWDGREVVLVGGRGGPSARTLQRVGFAYDPRTNRWRRLAPMPSGREQAAALWTGNRLLLWGGQAGCGGCSAYARRGLAYDPKADRWSPLPRSPLRGRVDATVVWTGRSLIVWGGGSGHPPYAGLNDGAVYTPATR